MMPPRIWLVGLDAQTGSTLSRLLSCRGFVAEQVTEKHLASGGNPKPTAIVLSVVDGDMPALDAVVSARERSPPIPAELLVGRDHGVMALADLVLGATTA